MLKKKFNIALLVVIFAILTLSFTALAADQEFKVTTNVTDGYTYSDGLLRFVKGGEYTIEMAEGVEQTTHRIIIDTGQISSDTGKITLIFSKLNMISYSENNITNNSLKMIDMNIVIDGNNTITNMNENNDNVNIHCLTLMGTNVTITGNGKLTLKAKDPNSQMVAKTFTLNSKDVILDFNYHCLTADGIYINSGEMNIISGADQCLLSNGEFYMTGGTLNVTSINGRPCIQVRDVGPRDGVGLEIRGNSNVTLRNTGTAQCIAPIYLYCTAYPKSIMINTTGTVRLENKGNGVAGIFFLGNKAKDFTISGGTLVIDGYMRGIWRYNGSSGNLNFNGGEIEIIGTTANAIYGRDSGEENGGSQGAYWGESYKHENYVGTAAETRSEISDSSVLNNSSSKYKYLLITPAYDITYNLDGGTVSPPDANPTRYTRVDNITLTNPTQNLKEFVGWTGSNGTVPQKEVIIPVGSKGDIGYKANWDNLPYSVYFYSNYEPVTYNTQTFKYDESEKLDANSFTRAGYNFTGWNTEEQPTTEKPGVHYDDQTELNISISNRLTEDRLSLWAQWNPIPAQPPTIINQPQNVDLIVGYSGEIKISIQAEAAENHTITGYQWYSTSTGLVEDGVPIDNATTADYMIPTGKDVGKEYYYCIVTATRNDNGQTAAVTSNVATVTINPKQAQTIAAENVNATFGDTGKSVTATVTDPVTGGGEISYAVKPGSEEYIEVDLSNGALRIKKAGTAIVVVTAAETPTYAETTKEVIVTINKVFPTVIVPTAKELTYTGSAQQLVEAGSAIGGTMQYALGTATGPAFPFSITVPTETAAGTYYVWYRVIGDASHLNTEPAVIPVTILAIDEYVIIFNTDGGTVIPPQMVKRGERIIKPENPVKQGYTFIQWMNGQQPYDFSEPVTENLTLAAQWKESGTYLFTVGQDSRWQKESGITLKFQVHHTVDDQDTYKNFSFIEIDGKKISPDNYEKKSDGIIIELKPDFLELLDLGKHTLRLVFLDGSVDTSFEIVPREEKEVNVPDTGDRDYLWKWMGLAALCLIGIILLRRIRGK